MKYILNTINALAMTAFFTGISLLDSTGIAFVIAVCMVVTPMIWVILEMLFLWREL